jgi:predicted MarR family transcription regulator
MLRAIHTIAIRYEPYNSVIGALCVGGRKYRMSKQPSIKNAKQHKSPADSIYLAPGSTGLAMAEFEVAMIVLWHTFSRWVERCGQAAGVEGSTFDLALLHYLRLRRRPLRVADIAFALSIEDQHLVSYSVRKLVREGLLQSEKNGKEILYSTTPKSEESFERYVEVRQRLLISGIDMIKNPGFDVTALGGMLRTLSGNYEQAARAAASDWHVVSAD